MKMLAVETSSSALSIAVFENEKLLLETRLDYQKTHSERLIPLIHEGLTHLDLKPKDVDVFAASIGPGSFTGLRIGLATIKAMGQALNKPVIGVSTLEALAYNLPFASRVLCPIIDAQQEMVYWGQYQWNEDQLQTMVEPEIIKIKSLIVKLQAEERPVLFLGDGVAKFRDLLGHAFEDQVIFPPESCIPPSASAVGLLALKKLGLGEIQEPAQLLPIYMRKSQAEKQYEDRMRKEATHE